MTPFSFRPLAHTHMRVPLRQVVAVFVADPLGQGPAVRAAAFHGVPVYEHLPATQALEDPEDEQEQGSDDEASPPCHLPFPTAWWCHTGHPGVTRHPSMRQERRQEIALHEEIFAGTDEYVNRELSGEDLAKKAPAPSV